MKNIPNYDDWKNVAEKSLNGKQIESLSKKNYDNIIVKALYSREDIEYPSNLPGVPPYVRATSYLGYKIKKWNISQEIIASSAKEFNTKAKKNLRKGQNALRLYINSNEYLIIGYLKKIQIAFEGLDFYRIPINIEAYKSNLSALCLFIAYLEKNKLDISKVKGGVDFNPIGTLFQYSSLPYSLKFSFDILKSIIERFKDNNDFYLLAPSGEYFNLAGSNSVQEIAFTMTSAIKYIQLLLQRKLDINTIAKKMRVILMTDSDFFATIAKFRAARIIWANIIKAFGGNSESQKLNLYVKSTKTNKSPLDVHVNILRLTTEALSSVLGGANSIELATYDETLEKDSELGERLSRNIQNVLSEECNLRDTIDPAGGSYYIESLTNSIADESWKLIQKIESMGGIIDAGINNFIINEIEKTVTERNNNLATGKQTLVGVNRYPNIFEEGDFSYFQILDYLDALYIRFNCKLNKLNINNLNDIIKYFNRGLNIDEIDYSMNLIAPAHIDIYKFSTFWGPKEFYYLRLISDQFNDINLRPFEVFVAAIGKPSDYRQRLEATSEILNIAGIETVFNKDYNSIDKAITEFKKSDTDAILLCSSNEIYEDILQEFYSKIKSLNKNIQVLVAVNNKNEAEHFSNEMIDFLIYPNMNLVMALSTLQENIIDITEENDDEVEL